MRLFASSHVAAVADIRDFERHILSNFALNADVPLIDARGPAAVRDG